MVSATPIDVVLALGGGAARGVAHIGILQVLAEKGIRVRAISGTSIGAIVGGMYAADRMKPFVDYLLKLDARRMLRLLDPVVPRSGLLGGSRVVKKLTDFAGDARIEELPLPYCAVASDLRSGQEILLREGPLVEAIRASFAIPGVFTPVQVGGRWLVDGGVSTPVPIRPARDLVPGLPVIAVDLNNVDMVFEGEVVAMADASPEERELGRIERLLRRMRGDEERQPGLLASISDAITHMEHRLARFQIAADEPDLLIEPPVYGLGLFDFHRSETILKAGRRCAEKALEPEVLMRLRQLGS
ncbi:MAG: patatin-like phospholipase family protein [Planctomycetota bacterium]|jgi:NTE family protein